MAPKRGGLTMRAVMGSRFPAILIAAGLVVFSGCAEKDNSVFEVDNTPPVLSGAAESNGRISWVTDEDCNCVLLYGSRQGVYDHYSYNVHDGGKEHYVDLLDIDPGTYYFRIVATDRAGNETTSEETAFDVSRVPDDDEMVYTMVDVGWGDCHFLEFPNGTNVMVDAGYGSITDDGHDIDVFSFLGARGYSLKSDIDYMLATHSHADHYGGFIDLLGYYRVTTFLAAAESYSSVWGTNFGSSGTLEDRLNELNVPRDSLRAGQTSAECDFLDWDPDHGVEVKVLSAGAGRLIPPEQVEEEGDEGGATNNDSVVLMITFGDVDILLTADAEEFAEHRMVKTFGHGLDCEVLKVGHHGSYSSTTEEWLEFTTPRLGLIPNSMAENPGVFSQTVLNSLKGRGIDYFASDHAYRNPGRYDDPLDGNLSVTTDGTTFTVWSWKQ
jgi:beta-lactamase superfamily II metal-dependent hydrolase